MGKMLAVSVIFFCQTISAQTSGKKTVDLGGLKAPDRYAVVDGTVEELLARIEQLESTQPRVRKADQLRIHFKKTYEGVEKAADLILAKKPNERATVKAAQAKFRSLLLMAGLAEGDEQIKASQEKMEKFLDQLREDKRPLVVAEVEKQDLILAIPKLESPNPDEVARLRGMLDRLLDQGKLAADKIGIALELVSRLELTDQYQDVIEISKKLLARIRDSQFDEDEGVETAIVEFEEYLSRAEGVGKPYQLKGKLVSGEEFDWSKHQNQVVLIDYWATWCEVCLEEMGTLKKLHEKYHKKGFEIVAVSLDEDRSDLDEFLKEYEVPWVNLHTNEAPKALKGFPMTILVGRDGKVISVNPRGKRLEEHIAKLFEETEPKVPEKEKSE